MRMSQRLTPRQRPTRRRQLQQGILFCWIILFIALNIYYESQRRRRSKFELDISSSTSKSNIIIDDKKSTHSLFLRRHAGGDRDDVGRTTRTQHTVKDRWIQESAQPFNENNVASQNARILIIVAGHSVTMTGHLEDADMDEYDWYLLDYQKHRGLPQAIIRHIKEGIRLATTNTSTNTTVSTTTTESVVNNNNNKNKTEESHHNNNNNDSLLIFSGGETRAATGPETEGSSYYRVADAMDLWGPKHFNVRARTVTEEFATDSFENLLFSICRFYEITGRYPDKIIVVSFTFKRRRFETLHVPAIRWPMERFQYVGIDPPMDNTTGFNLEEATYGEYNNAAKLFETDPYGCHSLVLQEKRRSRNPFFRTPPYELSCPNMKQLLHYCGPNIISKENVPWVVI